MQIDALLDGKLYQQVWFLVVKDPVEPEALQRKKRVPGVIGANFIKMILQSKDWSQNFFSENQSLVQILQLLEKRMADCNSSSLRRAVLVGGLELIAKKIAHLPRSK